MAVTAYAAKGDEERIRDAGAEGYVSKPISVLRFVEAVRALLDAAAARACSAKVHASARKANATGSATNCLGSCTRLIRGRGVVDVGSGAYPVTKKVLVVEDNELNLKLFCDLLRAHGYEAEPVRDGWDAVDRARETCPDLIVMDIQLPHVTGLELIETIKADPSLKDVPIMAVTAYAAKGDEERIRDAGADSYLAKPVSIGPFMTAVRALL